MRRLPPEHCVNHDQKYMRIIVITRMYVMTLSQMKATTMVMTMMMTMMMTMSPTGENDLTG